jgi:hypothetical protein
MTTRAVILKWSGMALIIKSGKEAFTTINVVARILAGLRMTPLVCQSIIG